MRISPRPILRAFSCPVHFGLTPRARGRKVRAAAVDHGADIGVFSQYPGEKEYLWNPLSLVEPNGRPFVEDTPDGIVTILPVRVNMNVKTMTVEELRGQKKALHLSSFNFINDELSKRLDSEPVSSKVLEKMKRDRDIEPGQWGAKRREFALDIVQQCREVLDQHELLRPEDYVDPVIFRSLVKAMLDCNMFALSKVQAYIEDPSEKLRMLYKTPLRIAHRRYVSYLERCYTQKLGPRSISAGATPSPPSSAQLEEEAAWTLCRVKGLLTRERPEDATGSNDLEMVENEPRIVAAASEDLSSDSLRLLVAARANVNAVDGWGTTAIMRAASGGNDGAVRVLHELGGGPAKVRDDGITAMHFAAWEGHVACIRTLYALGARPDVMSEKRHTPLMAAAENGHADVIVEVARMAEMKNGMDTANMLNMTAMHYAAKYNHKECILALDRYNAKADFHALVYARYYGDPESDECYDCVVVLAQLLMRPRAKDAVWVKVNGANRAGTVARIDESVHPFYVKFEDGKSNGWFSRQVWRS